MIYLYTGTPGSGKSFHIASEIYDLLKYSDKKVIANFPINFDVMKPKYGKIFYRLLSLITRRKYIDKNYKKQFFYLPNNLLTPKVLKRFSKVHLKMGHESQALIVIDECASIFNCRNWQVADRAEWINFFQLHRKLGFDIVLISQSDRLIDRQIRAFCEYEYKHRNAKNFKLAGRVLAILFGGSCFVCLKYWYGCNERIGTNFFRFSKRIASIYDTYKIFE